MEHENARFNRQYRDTLFKAIFKDKARLLSLYNALNGTSYTNADDIEFTTIENVIYVTMKNDLSFLIASEMNLYEQLFGGGILATAKHEFLFGNSRRSRTGRAASPIGRSSLEASRLALAARPKRTRFVKPRIRHALRVVCVIGNYYLVRVPRTYASVRGAAFNSDRRSRRILLDALRVCAKRKLGSGRYKDVQPAKLLKKCKPLYELQRVCEPHKAELLNAPLKWRGAFNGKFALQTCHINVCAKRAPKRPLANLTICSRPLFKEAANGMAKDDAIRDALDPETSSG